MSVKVAVRVRPFNEREKNLGAVCCVDMAGPQTIIRDPSGGDATNKSGERTFAFDYSFWSHDDFTNDEEGYSSAASPNSKYADQKQVFEALGQQVLDNAWQGYHCCLFAYGQTGSGKSYSMIGFGTNKGIVPKVCDEIFKRIANSTDTTKYEVEFSMMEIYNEKVQDLMEKDETKKPLGGLQVRQKPSGEVYVQNLSRHAVDSYALIDQKMDQGFTNRSIGATKMNQTSSRAHTIITILFKQINVVDGRKVEKYSAINLVDLAGSEKAGQTGAEGQRLKEGCAINKSLTVLGNCISVLADKAGGKAAKAVVPYRDSNLTRILQNALGGNSKTIMVCAISPADTNYEESLSTLRYADRAKKIVNKAIINESVQDKIIRELRAQNDKLTKILREAARKGGGVINWSDLDLGDAQDVADQMDHAQQELQNMEKTWEERLQEQREKDEGERQNAINEQEHEQLKNKRAPHLTNLNEDAQLSGKVYYNLGDLGKEDVKIGRQDEEDLNEIVLRGIGIQQNHAQFKIEQNGQIKMLVRGQEALESTLVNGQKLQPSKSNFGSRAVDVDADGEPLHEYSVLMNHLDRIALGTGQQQLFMFRYPLQKFTKEKIMKEIQEGDPTLEPEEVEAKFEQQIELNGLTQDLTNLVCDEYPEAAIHEDDAMTRDCFESAYEEVQQAEEEKQAQVMFEQQQAYDLKMKEMEDAFKKQFDTMQRQQVEAEQRAKDLYDKQLPAEPQKKGEVPPPVPVDPKVLEMERKMKELMEQLNKKDESLKQVELENQRKLQEQQEAVQKEKQGKLEYEQQMLMLKHQLSGVQNEFEGHKKLSQQQMEENTKRLQMELEQEKQRVMQEKEAQDKEQAAQLQKLNKELQEKDQTLQSVQTDNEKKLQQQMQQMENEKKIKGQVDEQMKKLQQQLIGVQSQYENQKTMTKQQLDEQKLNLHKQFQQEKQKLVDLEKVKELQSQMEQLNTQLQQKDESLKSVELDKEKKLQEQMEAIKKEQENKLLTEQKMKELESKLQGVQSEYEGHKKMSQQQLEEEKKRQQEQLEQEKQRLIQEKNQKEQELQSQMQKLNQELEKKDQTLIAVEKDTQRKMQEQQEQIKREKEYKAQVENQMKQLQEKFVKVQKDSETEKTMSAQQMEEQKKKLMEQFQQERKKLVDMEKMTALQDEMKQLNQQLQQRDETLKQEQVDKQKLLQEQMDAITKEKQTKAQVEEQMKKLQQQYMNAQSEFENQKTMTKQQLEEQKSSLMEQFKSEKQKLVEIDKFNELKNQMSDINQQLQQKDESLKNVQNESERKLKEQEEKAEQERKLRAQIQEQMKSLQEQYLKMQSDKESQKTMSQQQLDEQKQNLMKQFQEEKGKLVALDKLQETEARMKQLTQQLEEKDSTLNQIKSETENKLLEQSEAITKEKQTREQVEEQKTKLQQQLMGVQSEYQNQKQASQQMLEKQQKELQDKLQQEKKQIEEAKEKHAAEKQQLESRIQSLYQKQLPNEPSPSKGIPQAPPVPLDKKSAELEKQMKKLGNELNQKDGALKDQENAHMWQNMKQRSEIVEAKDKHLSAEKEKAELQLKLQNVQQVKNHQAMLTKQQLEEQEKKLRDKFEKEKEQLEIERRKQTFITQKRNELSENAKKVKEANDICRILKKDIHLKQILTRVQVDDSGRKTTLIVNEDHSKAKFKEELQIQVTNNDKRGAVTMWSEQKFEDKLIMMRDALVEYEQEQEKRRKLRQKEENKKQGEDDDFSALRRSSLSAVNEEIFDQHNKEEQVAQMGAEMDQMLLSNDIKLEMKENKGEVEDSLDFHKMLEQNQAQNRRETHNPKVPKELQSTPNTVQMNDNIDTFMEEQYKEDGLKSTNDEISQMNEEIKNLRKSAKNIQKASKQKDNAQAQGNPSKQFPNLDNLDGLEAFNMSNPPKADAQFDFNMPQDQQQPDSMFQDSLFAAFSGNQLQGRDRTQWLDDQLKKQAQKEEQHDPFAHHKQERFTQSYKPLKEAGTNVRQDYKKEEVVEGDARMPSYYTKDHVPHETPKDRQNVEVRQTYLHHLLSKYTPVEVQADLFMKPIPREIGQIQCNIIRDKSGLNKLSPKFYMELSYGKKAMLKAEKLQFSSTAHYKITINSDEAKYLKNKDQGYLGRLRGNLGQGQFYIFDKGDNPKATQNNAVPELRKQYGTITYAGKDKFGAKEARNVDVYIPQIMTNSGTIKAWEDLPNKKKQFIDKEYELQQSDKMNEFIKKHQDMSMTSMTDINEMTSDIMYFKSRNDEGYLDFESTGGIAPKASKKNFQLTDDFDQTKVYMQFGRMDDNTFNVELSHPFSLFQAFGLCLSTFESKI